MIDTTDLRLIGLNRWTVPLLAELLVQDGSRFAVVLVSLGIARESLTRTLAHAMACGWVARNTGHGHPLRPEYVLSPAGRALAQGCARVMQVRRALDIPAGALPRWSMPILHRLGGGQRRFSTLRDELAPVTSRALSLNLKQMTQTGLVARQTDEGFPPASFYSLNPPGRAVLDALTVRD